MTYGILQIYSFTSINIVKCFLKSHQKPQAIFKLSCSLPLSVIESFRIATSATAVIPFKKHSNVQEPESPKIIRRKVIFEVPQQHSFPLLSKCPWQHPKNLTPLENYTLLSKKKDDGKVFQGGLFSLRISLNNFLKMLKEKNLEL